MPTNCGAYSLTRGDISIVPLLNQPSILEICEVLLHVGSVPGIGVAVRIEDAIGSAVDVSRHSGSELVELLGWQWYHTIREPGKPQGSRMWQSDCGHDADLLKASVGHTCRSGKCRLHPKSHL